MSLAYEVSPTEILSRRDSGEQLCLIDVREPVEWALARIEGATLVPMNTVPSRLQELDAQSDEMMLIVYCHHGIRSLNVVNWLRAQGVANCQSMTGGIERWSIEADPSVPRY